MSGTSGPYSGIRGAATNDRGKVLPQNAGNGIVDPVIHVLFKARAEAPEPRGQLPPPLPFAHGGRGQLCPFLTAIELFYHPNNFASVVRNVINESEQIVVGRHWSF